MLSESFEYSFLFVLFLFCCFYGIFRFYFLFDFAFFSGFFDFIWGFGTLGVGAGIFLFFLVRGLFFHFFSHIAFTKFLLINFSFLVRWLAVFSFDFK